MFKIYVLRNQSSQLNGQKADEVLISSDPKLLEDFSDNKIIGNIPILDKKEYYIDPMTNEIVSGKHLPGSKLKISAADLFNMNNNFIMASIWKSDLSIHYHTTKNDVPLLPEKIIYVFQRI